MLILDPLQAGDDPRQVLVGFSGGLDSTVLLHQLATSVDFGKHDVRAVHVNHGLHPEADVWATHCQQFCDEFEIPLTVVHVDVSRDSGNGLEASARKARHDAFEAEMRDDEILVLAHHRDDQAETFLLRALRASGPDGLGAMRAWRAFGRGWLWRPLLDIALADLQMYARQHEMQWIEDSSNTDTALDRNFLRHRVLPLLRERWPHVDAAFARSASLSAEAGGLLDQEDAQSLLSVQGHDPRTLDAEELLKLPIARRARVLRRWIGRLRLPPLPSQGINRIESDLLDATLDANAAFAWSGAVVHRWRNILHADIQRAPLPADWQAVWDGRRGLSLPGGDVLKLSGADGFDAPVSLHARRGGERITLPGRSHSHTLKHVLQDMGVPPWQRERLPLLSTQVGELLAVGDLVYSGPFDAWLRDRSARLQIVVDDD